MSKSRELQTIVTLLALFSAGMTLAQGPDRKGTTAWYAGGAIGRGGYDADFERTNASILSTGATTFSGQAKTTDTMWKGYVGYQYSRYVSLEGGYWNFGRARYTANITAPVTTSMQRRFSAEGYGADIALWMPVSESWAAFAKVGALQVTTKASSAEAGGGLTALSAQSDRNLNSHWGVGVEYRVSRNLAARLENETVRKIGDDAKYGTADVIMWSFGANYRF